MTRATRYRRSQSRRTMAEVPRFAFSPMVFRMIPRPEAVVFDFGGTLYDDVFDVAAGQRRMIELAEQDSIDFAQYSDVCAKIDGELTNRRLASLVEHAMISFVHLAGDHVGITYAVDDQFLEMEFWKASERCEPVPGAREVVAQLKREGMRTAILSNMTFSSAVIRYELRRQGIEQSFDHVATSTDYGVRKPHRLPFEAIAGRLGVTTGECWYVGDRLEVDALGAQNAGMKAVWLNRAGEHSYSSIIPDLEIQDWSEFQEIWKNLRASRRRRPENRHSPDIPPASSQSRSSTAR